jgi:hypothetical protein
MQSIAVSQFDTGTCNMRFSHYMYCTDTIVKHVDERFIVAAEVVGINLRNTIESCDGLK